MNTDSQLHRLPQLLNEAASKDFLVCLTQITSTDWSALLMRVTKRGQQGVGHGEGKTAEGALAAALADTKRVRYQLPARLPHTISTIRGKITVDDL